MSGHQWPQMPSHDKGYGDPDVQVVVPPAQFLSHYVFFTDATYPETSLVIIRAPDASNTFRDVTLDCAGTLSGWQPVGKYEYTRVRLQTGDFQDVGGCSNGPHEMSSAAPFGVSVWGWGSAVSYSYAAGQNVHPINGVVVPAQPK